MNFYFLKLESLVSYNAQIYCIIHIQVDYTTINLDIADEYMNFS